MIYIYIYMRRGQQYRLLILVEGVVVAANAEERWGRAKLILLFDTIDTLG